MASALPDMPQILSQIAQHSSRPRYAFALLNLIGEAADANGRAGPYVTRGNQVAALRDWLSDSLSPLAGRDPKRISLTERVRAALEDSLPEDAAEAEEIVAARVQDLVRAAGRANVSRTVSELVRSGLVRRHYVGYRRNHENRGAGRQAVYTLAPEALAALRRSTQLF